MDHELKRRQQAIKMYYYQNGSKKRICRQLRCSRTWLNRWLDRYNPDSPVRSLENRSPLSKSKVPRWSTQIRQQVIKMRRLRSDGQKSTYALVGAKAIHYELKALGSTQVPPVRTIHRWLVEAGLVVNQSCDDLGSKEKKSIPIPQATTVNCLHQLDLKGPIYLRNSSTKNYLVVLKDRFSHQTALSPLTSRCACGIVEFLVKTWQSMGLPRYLQMDNPLELGGSNRYPRSLSPVVRVALDLGIEPVFIPTSEPWWNGCVERFNGFIDQTLLTVELASYQERDVMFTICRPTRFISRPRNWELIGLGLNTLFSPE